MALTVLGRPVRLSFAWLKPPPIPPDGSMTLFEHLRELRYRLVIAVGAILLGMILSFVFYDQLFYILRHPYDVAIAALKEKNPDQITDLVNLGLASPFTLMLKVCLTSGLVLTSPVWLYQLWSFIVPGLELVDASFIRRAEPHVSGTVALWSPSSGRVEAEALVKAMRKRERI